MFFIARAKPLRALQIETELQNNWEMAIITQIVCVSGEEGLQRAGSAVISLVCMFS